MATWGHCPEAVELLIAKGADVNAKSASDGRTALMQAAGDGHVELVRVLLDHGGDFETRDEAGRNAWTYAAMAGQQEIADMFRKAREKKQ